MIWLKIIVTIGALCFTYEYLKKNYKTLSKYKHLSYYIVQNFCLTPYSWLLLRWSMWPMGLLFFILILFIRIFSVLWLDRKLVHEWDRIFEEYFHEFFGHQCVIFYVFHINHYKMYFIVYTVHEFTY